MRINIEIDENLLADAKRSSGAKTVRQAVEAGLRLLIQVRRQSGIRRLRGKVKWQGELNQSRLGRNAR